jgi:glycosyltransferase involved in cell wall biosynthesis
MINRLNLKIIQLIDNLDPGGAERMSINISNVLADNEISSYLCSTRKGGLLQNSISSKVSFLQLKKTKKFDVLNFCRLNNFIKSNNINVVHAHSSSILWGAFLKIINPKITLIWHDHFGDRLNDKKRNFFYIIISMFIDRVIVVNEDLEKWAKKKLFVSKKNITYLKNFSYFQFTNDVSKKNDIINIIHLANLKKPKNHHLLIDAINVVVKEYPLLKFNVLLVGKSYNDEYYVTLLDKIKKFKLEKYFTFIGMTSNPEHYLEKADIGILCSTYEGLPVSIIEYAMFKLPVISTDVGECKEVLDNGKAGWLVQQNNLTSMAQAIVEAITNREKAEIFSKNLNKRVSVLYGSDNFLKTYLEFIN